MIWLEDVAVGDVTRFGEYRVTRDEVIAFAERYDPQPFHLSDEAAAATHFGRLSASGWHTASMAMAMIVEHFRDTGFQSIGSPGVDELRWTKPVYPATRSTARRRCWRRAHPPAARRWGSSSAAGPCSIRTTCRS